MSHDLDESILKMTRDELLEEVADRIQCMRELMMLHRKEERLLKQDIKMLECSKGFTERNFALSEYTDATGRKLPYYNITKDGFVFLAMGFTGKEAAKFKEDYINAFNWMQENLIKRGMSMMQRHNFVSLKFTRRKETISDSARNMRSWQDEKPLLLEELEQIEREIQPYLPQLDVDDSGARQ